MFQAADRLPIVQAMIMAETHRGARTSTWPSCCPSSEGDFEGIFRAMRGLPVTIRLLDPPLHEFLPRLIDLMVEVDRRRARSGTLGRGARRAAKGWCS